MSDPTCGAQKPGDFPGPFDWWLFAAIGAAAGALGWVAGHGVPGANQLIALFSGSNPVLPGGGLVSASAAAMMVASAAGALLVLALVAYYLFQPDGCIVPKPRSQPVCASGIVEQTFDLNSTAVAILAPFAIGPAGGFDVVVKSVYWNLVTQNAFWVYCSATGAAMLRCIVKSETSCGARVGSMVGAAAAAILAIALGFLAGAAIASLACGPFAWACFLLALLVALIVAAAITYGGAMIGGWIGAGIGLIGDDPVGDAWKSLEAGAIVTVRGDWTANSDIGNNELFYTTQINRTGMFGAPPSYTTAQADSTAPDDCPLVPPAPG